MEGRASLLRLLTVGIVAVSLLGALPAEAQQPHLAISEVNWELRDRDATREYLEIANLGSTAWNPNDHWLFRARFRIDNESENTQLWVRIQNVDPVPPGGVLFIEWGRPLIEDNETTDTQCTPGPNVFCTGREGFNSTDLEQHTALAVFAPTSDNTAPTVDGGTMLCYYFQGDLQAEGVDRALAGYEKAVKSKLWKDGDVIGPTACDWARALRMAPGGNYPPDHGRKASDYYLTLAGIPILDNTGLGLVSPTAPGPNTKNRAGTIAQPNYLHPGLPIPGQIQASFLSVRALAVPASLATNAPPAAIQVAGINAAGAVATTLLSNNVWSPVTLVNGAPIADGFQLLNNPARASRTLIIRAKADGVLVASTATTGPEFGAPADLGVKAQFAPAAVVDAAGNEHYLAVEAGTGNILHNINEGGKLRGWQAIPGATTNAPVAAAFTSDPAGLSVAAFNGNQLVLTRLGADGKFGPWQNVGAALPERPAGIGPTLAWNAQAKRLEIAVLAGSSESAEVQHARVEILAVGEARIGPLGKIAGISTNAAPAIAVSDGGQIRLLARNGGKEPGLNPRVDEDLSGAYGEGMEADPGDPQSGFVFGATFDGTAWSTPARVGVARLPGPGRAHPALTAPVAPVTLFDSNTRQFRDFLIGEDGQIYHNPVQ
jgi:hypothetical protein